MAVKLKIKKGPTEHALLAMARKNIPYVAVTTLKDAIKRGEAKIEKIQQERWAVLYDKYIYILNPEKKIIVTAVTIEEYKNQFTNFYSKIFTS